LKARIKNVVKHDKLAIPADIHTSRFIPVGSYQATCYVNFNTIYTVATISIVSISLHFVAITTVAMENTDY